MSFYATMYTCIFVCMYAVMYSNINVCFMSECMFALQYSMYTLVFARIYVCNYLYISNINVSMYVVIGLRRCKKR